MVGYNKKQNWRDGPTLEETRPDHAMRNSLAITKLPLGRDTRKKKKEEEEQQQQIGEIQFFEKKIFLFFFLNFSGFFNFLA